MDSRSIRITEYTCNTKYWQGGLKNGRYIILFTGKTGFWIGLPGCLKEYDELAEKFSKNTGIGSKDRDKIIKQTETLIETQNEGESNIGKKYLKIMKSVQTDGSEFLNKEISRLENLLDSKKKMSLAKRNDLQNNLNIFKSFHIVHDVKEEL